MGIDVQARDGIVAVVIDFPPVNALPARGWYEPGGRHHHGRHRSGNPGRDPARDGPRLLRRR